jgi:hypothetical protein
MFRLNERTYKVFNQVSPAGHKAASAAQIWDFGPIGRLYMRSVYLCNLEQLSLRSVFAELLSRRQLIRVDGGCL